MDSANRFTHALQNDPSSVELVAGLRRHIPTIVAAAIVGGVFALIVSLVQPPQYTSTASVVIDGTGDSTATKLVNMATEKQIASSGAVAGAVVQTLNLDATPEDVLRGLSVSVPVDTDVLVLSYTASDPALARRRAQAFVDAYLKLRERVLLDSVEASNEAVRTRIDQLREDLHGLTTRAESEPDPEKRAALQVAANAVLSQISIQEQKLASQADALTIEGRQLTGASIPSSPSGPKIVVNTIAGLFVGAVLGTFIALMRAALARTHTAEGMAEALGVPVLAVVPRSRRAERDGIVVTRASPATEAYRRLVAQLLALPSVEPSQRTGGRTMAIVGVGDRPDPAVAAANLGAAMALSGKRIALVSARVEDRRLETIFDTPSAPGISDMIRQRSSVRDAMRETPFASLKVVPAGSKEGRWALLDADAVRRAIGQIASRADVVMVEAPGPFAGETGALVAACGEVLLVGSLRATSLDEARRARSEFEGLGTPCIGIAAFDHPRAPRRRTRRTTPQEPEVSDVADAEWMPLSIEPSLGSVGPSTSAKTGPQR